MAWTKADHLRVTFQTCPRCQGRVFWGDDGDTRWLHITGIRGSCVLCAQEFYTMDLLSAKEDERRRELAALDAKKRPCSSCGEPFLPSDRIPSKSGRPRTRCDKCYVRRVLEAA